MRFVQDGNGAGTDGGVELWPSDVPDDYWAGDAGSVYTDAGSVSTAAGMTQADWETALRHGE